MTAYVGIDGKARKIGAAYIGVDGVARKVVKAYVGVDGVAQLWWVADEPNAPVVLEVKKITSDTYAGSTTYTGEQFVLLDIYPKTNGTVNVTYGGLTKTITEELGAEYPNAQQVFFGTFNGVSDSVETPASGTLTIDGEYGSFTVGSYSKSSKDTGIRCGCITAVEDWGGIVNISGSTFKDCDGLTSIVVPRNISMTGDSNFENCDGLKTAVIEGSSLGATLTGNFFGCSNLETVSLLTARMTGKDFVGCKSLASFVIGANNNYLSADGAVLFNKGKTELLAYPSVSGHYVVPDGVTSIGIEAFRKSDLASIEIADSVTKIGNYAFSEVENLTSVVIPSNVRSIGALAFSDSALVNVTFLSTEPPALGSSAFTESTTNMPTFTVPKGCGEAYKAAEGWSTYANKIVEAS